jgi:hypothetical protein
MLLAATLAASVISPVAGASGVFKWRDAAGRMNYSDVCPADARCLPKRINASATSFAGATSEASTPAVSADAPAATKNVGSASIGATGRLAGSLKTALASASEKLCRGNGKRSCPPEPTPPPPDDTTTPPPPDTTTPPPPDTTTPPPDTSTPPPPDNNGSVVRSALGTNLEAISYWSPQIPFVNVMKSSSGWISGDGSAWDNGKALDLDVNGWVKSLASGQIARKLMLREFGDRYPAGQYVVRYQGEGVIRFNFAARTVSEAPGEIIIQVTPSSDGVLMTVEQTNPANYVRNISITMPGGICQGQPFTHVPSAASCSADRPYLSFADHHGSILFNPVFADRLRAYSVLRFMDWMHTNNSSVKTWLQRTPVAYSTWATTSGAPPEVMIALANLVGAHPWFNIPHQADDAYVSNLAQLVKSTLNPALQVYVEHSNEVWNTMFQQTGYAAQRGEAQGLDGYQYHAQRSRAIGQTFKSALGEARVVAVLGAQAANPWTARQGLEYLKQHSGTYGSLGIDAVAIAPYFGGAIDPNSASQYTAMTMDQLFALARSTMLPQAQAYTTAYRSLAAEFNMSLLAYEGGQHLVGYHGAENDAALNQLLDAFNRDPRMKQLYLDYLEGWKREGGGLFVHFTDVGRYTKWGRWGALEYIAQPRAGAPKFDAIQTFIEQNPVWWTQ